MNEQQQMDVEWIAGICSELDGLEVGIFPMDGAEPDTMPIRIRLDLDGTGQTGIGYYNLADAEQIIASLTEAVRRVRDAQAAT